MFGNIWGMMGNLEERTVDRYELGDLIVSTVRVTDSILPWETGVSHPEYNSGKWVIVEKYESKEDAKEGHQRWVQKMTGETLPDELRDVADSEIGLLNDVFGKEWRVFRRGETKEEE